ncbi:MAG: ABC transporter substrate-binding protein [Rhodospirillaceae bacterium]|nr:ABC transporter substrate-binding protein [Rhodospirillaceae bacterium]
MRFNSKLSISLVLAGFILGGCEQSLEINPQPYISPLGNDLNDIVNFETATGPEETHPAAQRIEQLSREVIAILSNSAISRDQKEAHFGKLLARDLDIPLIGRFVMGKHWRRADQQQRQIYMKVFRNYLIRTYSVRLGGTEVESFNIINTKVIGKKDILVRSKVVKAHKKSVQADWRLRRRNGTYLILDLSVEGISLALTLRQEFSAILKGKGGLTTLINMLRKRNA